MSIKTNKYEINGYTPLQYAELFIDRHMVRIPAKEFSFTYVGAEGNFTYQQGIVLRGIQEIYKRDGKKEYKKYITDWLECVTYENGVPQGDEKGWKSRESLDYRQPGSLFFDLYKETGDEKYLNGLDYLFEDIKNFKKTSHGLFFHNISGSRNHQVLVDGLFMASPSSVKYAVLRDDKELLDIAMDQPVIMWENMRDEATGLLRHAWDESKQAKWADKETGLSHFVWSRAIGWYAAGITEIYEAAPKDHKNIPKIRKIIKELFTNVVKYQTKNGRWYQIIDKGDDPRNWIDNSGTFLILYAMAKAIKNGVLDESFVENVMRGYTDAIVNSTVITEDGFNILDICEGTVVGEIVEYYYYRRRVVNEEHGVGGFLLMCAEIDAMLEMIDG